MYLKSVPWTYFIFNLHDRHTRLIARYALLTILLPAPLGPSGLLHLYEVAMRKAWERLPISAVGDANPSFTLYHMFIIIRSDFAVGTRPWGMSVGAIPAPSLACRACLAGRNRPWLGGARRARVHNTTTIRSREGCAQWRDFVLRSP